MNKDNKMSSKNLIQKVKEGFSNWKRNLAMGAMALPLSFALACGSGGGGGGGTVPDPEPEPQEEVLTVENVYEYFWDGTQRRALDASSEATNAGMDSYFEAEFSHDVKEETASSVGLYGTGGSLIPSTKIVNGNKVQVTPSTTLGDNTNYVLTIGYGLKGVGNTLEEVLFDVDADMFGGEETDDNVDYSVSTASRPQATTNPANGTEGVSVDSDIVVTYSEEGDYTPTLEDASGNPVPFSSAVVSATQLRLDPASLLGNETQYTVNVSGYSDSGSPMDETGQSFTTSLSATQVYDAVKAKFTELGAVISEDQLIQLDTGVLRAPMIATYDYNGSTWDIAVVPDPSGSLADLINAHSGVFPYTGTYDNGSVSRTEAESMPSEWQADYRTLVE